MSPGRRVTASRRVVHDRPGPGGRGHSVGARRGRTPRASGTKQRTGAMHQASARSAPRR
ncbi:hypothetical protein Ae263Ps1_4696c [Pseudonocardia sp. Ae263_Ps1]|nr:hypothetical protein Ae263Ps1_4696c [Pseudonocardia sp. Ae263_Ps1]OLL92332.1 hypothetical protein Ae356Ps1_2229 [Pseudonocardia sp. Ae356_Ps1]